MLKYSRSAKWQNGEGQGRKQPLTNYCDTRAQCLVSKKIRICHLAQKGRRYTLFSEMKSNVV